MPRRDGEGSVVTLNALELATLLDGLLRGGIDAPSRLSEVEGGFAHKDTITAFQLYTTKPKSILLLFAIVVLPLLNPFLDLKIFY